MDDECRIRQTSSNSTIDIYIGSKPADEFDVCLDRFLQNENSREREIKVVEMIGKQEYLDELKPYEIGSWGDIFVSSSIHYHAPDEQTESDEEKNVFTQVHGNIIRWSAVFDCDEDTFCQLFLYIFHRDGQGNIRKIPYEDLHLDVKLTAGMRDRYSVDVNIYGQDGLSPECGRYYMVMLGRPNVNTVMYEPIIVSMNIVAANGKIAPARTQMVGMESIEQQMNAIAKQKLFNDQRQAMNMPVFPINLHAAVMGERGSGKSAFAHVLYEFYRKNGLIGDGMLHIIDASRWLNISESDTPVGEDMTKARNGLLYIENAAAMISTDTRGNNEYAVQALVRQLRDNTHNTTVVLADTMENLTGLLNTADLKSFIGQTYHLPSLSLDQMLEVAEKECRQRHFTLSGNAKKALRAYLGTQVHATAADVVEVIEATLMNMSARVVNASEQLFEKPEYLSEIRAEDIPQQQVSRYDESIGKLHNMIGLKRLKYTIESHLSLVRFAQLRHQHGLTAAMPPLHMIFTGNPGTGKTTVAGLLGEIYASLGILKTGKVIRADRKSLVGKYIGDTEDNTKRVLQQAHGNILFIDEAYNLVDNTEEKKDYGPKVIDCLMDELGKEHTDMIIILAGYPDEMDTLLKSNKGLHSRFPYTFHFEDYNEDELIEIARQTAGQSGYIFSPEALLRLGELVHREVERSAAHEQKHFGNARFITRLISTQIIPNMSRRVLGSEVADAAGSENTDDLQRLSRIEAADIPRTAQNTDFAINEALISRTFQQLDQMVGMADVKRALHDLVGAARARWQANGDVLDTIPLQWTFTGSTGTGKSSVAKRLASLLHAFGLINSDRMTQLRMAQTDNNTWSAYEIDKLLRDTMKQAGQGLLFIDLDDVANQHIDIRWLRCKLTSLTAEMPGSYAFVIAVDDKRLAPQPIDMPLSTSVIHFADYTADELMAILVQRLSRHGYTLTDEASSLLGEHIARLCRNKSYGYANARTMKHLFTALTSAAELRLALTSAAELSPADTGQPGTPVAITREDVDSFPWNPLPSNRIGYDA